MIKFQTKEDLRHLNEISEPELRALILKQFVRLNEDSDPQTTLYCSPSPIGTLGSIWIAQNQSEIEQLDFIEVNQLIMQSPVFVCSYISKQDAADVYIPTSILSNEKRKELQSQTNEIILACR